MGFIESFVELLKKQDLIVNCCGNDKFEIWNIRDNKELGFVRFDAFPQNRMIRQNDFSRVESC